LLLIEKIDIAKGQSYNAVSFSVSLDKVLEEVFKYIKKEDVKYKIVPQKTISQQVYTINCDKFKSIGFTPKGNLSATVKQIIDGLKVLDILKDTLANCPKKYMGGMLNDLQKFFDTVGMNIKVKVIDENETMDTTV
jgi:hypothetical protein